MPDSFKTGDHFEDSSDEINDIRVLGGDLIRSDFADLVEGFIRKDSALWHLKTDMSRPLTWRQRLRLKWHDFRWWLGHKIVGYECDDG